MNAPVTADGWSAYDDAVPHPRGLAEVVERTSGLRALRHPPHGASLADVRRVIVVVSSSRGGSTLVGQALRQVPGLLHLRAEVNPLFTLAGLHEGPDRRQVLEAELLRDIGTPAAPGDFAPGERERLVLDLAWRLTVQWPALSESVELDELLALVDEAVPQVGRDYEPVAVHLSVLEGLRRSGAAVHAGYYDMPDSALVGSRELPDGPPADTVIEMPPFVAVDRWQHASPAELRSKPLVLCTPRLAFRLEFVRDLVPNAELRVVHLTRNPAASVNGLVDGWRHHGFFTCRVPGGLTVDGYSDVVPGGTEWWCYDFPPGWEAWTRSPLEQVCAFQWRATHRAAMEGCERIGVEPLRVRFEDVVGPKRRRLQVARELAPLLGVGDRAVADALTADLPVVMATTQPEPARWRCRTGDLGDVLSDPAVLGMARELGYGDDRADWV